MSTYLCYAALVNDRIRYLSQSYGNTRAIGFMPRSGCPDFGAALKRVVTMFANFDPRTRDAWNEYPAAPRLCRQHDICYVSMDDDRLRATLVNYFEANLPREMGRTVRSEDDETEFTYDEAEVSRVARELAARFMDEEIEVACFMRDEPVISHPEFALGLTRHQPSAVCS